MRSRVQANRHRRLARPPCLFVFCCVFSATCAYALGHLLYRSRLRHQSCPVAGNGTASALHPTLPRLTLATAAIPTSANHFLSCDQQATSYMSLPNAPSQPGPSKVAIPKLVQKKTDAPRKPAASRLNRVNRACLSCRSRKIKCNGAKPTCFNCRESGTSCVYASSRKDRLKTLVMPLCRARPELMFAAQRAKTKT